MDDLSKKCTSDNLIKYIVGCKSDLSSKRQVTTQEAEELAQFYNCEYIETSAKDGINIDELYMGIAHKIYEQKKTLKDLSKIVILTQP